MRRWRESGRWKYIIGLAAAIGIFMYSFGNILFIMYDYRVGVEEYTKLQNMVLLSAEDMLAKRVPMGVQEESGNALDLVDIQTEKEQVKYVDFNALEEVNPDTKGWIRMDGTVINYPIVQAEDNEYYLHRTIYGTDNSAGTLFLDYHIEEGMEGKNVIIYGHNMKNGTMFANLKYYREKTMWENYPIFEVYTKDAFYKYQIFAVYTTTAGSDAYSYAFASEESFLRYIERMKEKSFYETGVTVEADDHIMTLSTCEGSDNERFVVQAKRLQ